MELTSSDWDLLLRGAKRVYFRKGDVVLQEGTRTQRIVQVINGYCRIEKVTLPFSFSSSLPLSLSLLSLYISTESRESFIYDSSSTSSPSFLSLHIYKPRGNNIPPTSRTIYDSSFTFLHPIYPVKVGENIFIIHPPPSLSSLPFLSPFLSTFIKLITILLYNTHL